MVMRPALINQMAQAAETAGRTLARSFERIERVQVKQKGTADYVTSADYKAQEVIREILSEARPDYGFLAEEEDGKDNKVGAKERWIIDPLDGTKNFIHGIPRWCITIAAEKDGQVMAGIIYNPMTEELYWAEKGVGAYCGRKSLHVSGRTDLTECLISTSLLYRGNRADSELSVRQAMKVCSLTAGVRREGSAALDMANVAAGRCDGYWSSSCLSPWDVAAGALIIKEAGGRVSPMVEGGDPLKSAQLIASNANIHDNLVSIIREVK